MAVDASEPVPGSELVAELAGGAAGKQAGQHNPASSEGRVLTLRLRLTCKTSPSYYVQHRIRINTEGKAKVVAAAWGKIPGITMRLQHTIRINTEGKAKVVASAWGKIPGTTIRLQHRIRITTEGKAKVVAAAWGRN